MSDNSKDKKPNSPVGNSSDGKFEDNQDIITPRSDSNTSARVTTDKHSRSMAVQSEQKQKESGKKTSGAKERYYNSNTADDKKELLNAADGAKKRMIQQMYVDKVNAARSGSKPSAGTVAAVATADKAETAAVTTNRVEKITAEKTATSAMQANNNEVTSYSAPVSSLKAAHDSNNYTRKNSVLQQTDAKSAHKRFYIKEKTTVKVSKEQQKQRRDFFTKKIAANNYRRKIVRYHQYKTDEVLKRSEQKVEKIYKDSNAEKSGFISASENAAAAAGMVKSVCNAVQSGNTAAAITAVPAEIIRNNFSKALSDTSIGQLTEGISIVTDTIKNSDNAADAVASVTGKVISEKIKKDFGNSYQAYRNKCAEARRDRRIEAVYKKQDKALSEIQHNKANEMTKSQDKAFVEKINKRDMKVSKAKFQLSKKKQMKSKVFKKKEVARQSFSRAGKGVGSDVKKAVWKKVSVAVLGSGVVPVILVFVMVIVILMLIAQALAPIGWLFKKPDNDPAMIDTDDLERLCVAAEKVKKTYSDRIDFINEEISKAINDSEYWYEDEEGNLHISKGTAFAIAENEFWHYDSKETIKVGDAEIAKKIIDELPIPYKGENPERWAKRKTIYPEDFDADSASFVDLMNLDKMYEIISEDEFDFYEFCVYFQVYNIKKKYPEDSLEEHMDEMFELNDGKAYEFFEKRVKYKSTIYFAYHFATDTANGLPVYTGADPGMEQLAIRKFQNAQFWGFFNQCLCKGACYDNCRGHQVNMFILKIVSYSEIFDDEDITITEEDRKVIDQLKESMEMLKTEIIPEVMETYSGTYFDDPENAETTTTRVHADPIL